MAILRPQEHHQLSQQSQRQLSKSLASTVSAGASCAGSATSVDARLMHAFGLVAPPGLSGDCGLGSAPPGVCSHSAMAGLMGRMPFDWCDDMSTDVGGEVSEVHSEVSESVSRDTDALGKSLLSCIADGTSPVDGFWHRPLAFPLASSTYWEDPIYSQWHSTAWICDWTAHSDWNQGDWRQGIW